METSTSLTPPSLREFCEKELGVELTEWQARLLLAIENGQTIMLQQPRSKGRLTTAELIELHYRYHLEMENVREQQMRAMDAFGNVFKDFNLEVEKTVGIFRELFNLLADALSTPSGPRHALPRQRRKDRPKRPRRMAYVPKRKVTRGQRR